MAGREGLGAAHRLRKQASAESIDFGKIRGRIQAALEGKGAEPDVNERGEVIFKQAVAKSGEEVPKPAPALEITAQQKRLSRVEIDRIKFGIPGMDELVPAGIPRNSVILLTGGPGSGKSVFALHFLVAGARDFKEAGAYISFEEPEESIRESAELFGWNVRELEKKNLLQVVWRDPYEVKTFSKAMGGQLYYLIKEHKIKRIVFDSITFFSLTEMSRYKVRKEVAALSKRLKSIGISSIFISEVPEAETQRGRFGMEEFVVDGIILLHNFLVRDTRQRALEVLKMRKTAHDTFLHPFTITSAGIRVYPKEQLFNE